MSSHLRESGVAVIELNAGHGLKIIMHHAALGGSPFDDALDKLLRRVAVAYGELANWPEKYGADYEDDRFMMHPFCWCGETDCPWCRGCECPETADHYFVDDEEVSFDAWLSFFQRETAPQPRYGGSPKEWAAWETKANKVNKRRRTSHEAVCSFCRGDGPAVAKGAEPGRSAPNFWYKPTDLKVWWYKYIGRSTETNRPVTQDDLSGIARLLRDQAAGAGCHPTGQDGPA
jgi:hypothetical protein